ncbi:hypothetical protein GQX73_g2435 [Xylaria multiplex]|uniref:Uncharacterized protein n=1 Tax=Xylaria multiplex TaxID=323545 RepID=A0A7C8MWF3_9PEZI|nr:hypothetical protein GQX73_g2435 [Xylaria multiplex]
MESTAQPPTQPTGQRTRRPLTSKEKSDLTFLRRIHLLNLDLSHDHLLCAYSASLRTPTPLIITAAEQLIARYWAGRDPARKPPGFESS